MIYKFWRFVKLVIYDDNNCTDYIYSLYWQHNSIQIIHLGVLRETIKPILNVASQNVEVTDYIFIVAGQEGMVASHSIPSTPNIRIFPK